MKKLIIGRNNTCDVIIPDTSDLVSRKQAVLTCSFWGKMVLYDTSNNGTYVNGQKLKSGKGIQVTRKDKICFAQIADLNWNDVKDPFRKEKLVSIISAVTAIIISLIVGLWILQPKDDTQKQKKTEIVKEQGETATTIKPQVVEEQPQLQPVKKVKKKKQISKKERGITPEDVMNKDVNENSPIVY